MMPLQLPWMPAGGGGSLPPFKQVLTTEQGVAPFDPLGLSGVGTGFVDGVFRWVIPPNAARIDGYNEEQVCWTARILDVHPHYNPAIDILQMAYYHDVMPPFSASNEQFGMCFGILDSDTAGKATATGLAPGIYTSTATALSSIGVRGSLFGGANNHGVGFIVDLDVATFQPTRAGSTVQSMLLDHWVRRSTGVFAAGGRLDGVSAFSLATGDWRMFVGHVKNTTTATAGTDFRGRLFSRVVRTTGLAGLP